MLTHASAVLEVNHFRCVCVSSWRFSICYMVDLTFAPRLMPKYRRSNYMK